MTSSLPDPAVRMDRILVYQGDALEVMASLPAGRFSGDAMGSSGIAWLIRGVAVLASNLLKTTGHLIIFCDWRMVPVLAPAVESSGLRWQNLLVWDKGSIGPGAGFRAQHELALHFTAGSPVYHAKNGSNVLGFPRQNRASKLHPTQKPGGLMSEILRVVVGNRGLILDPFAGSGSTLVAARSMGMRGVGVERDARYVKVIEDRLRQTVLPQD